MRDREHVGIACACACARVVCILEDLLPRESGYDRVRVRVARTGGQLSNGRSGRRHPVADAPQLFEHLKKSEVSEKLWRRLDVKMHRDFSSTRDRARGICQQE